ncbi:diguanylate cyclase (GGDEF)-like protein/PAS domain S-box-containing protein [Pseudomonas nitritireducens]|uniref:Diguanylate cyclase (GGDEF)-like protein/PAS domain S-box-containing protein n=1 Tax=Pseudomonas nitroreducens TaxID=46680 RepID=A0A7W7P2P7_PSENT|nr:diguanylate cyclase [Pseudomonas nitritireducens]MBB4865836.1 diguanylate cyclase (GGDEF)-like protein/PAS domain S-box-containing protein [Pseudomonas nitritireducens]
MNLRARLLWLCLPLFAASLAGVWLLSDLILLDRFDRGDRQRLADEVRIVHNRVAFEKQRYLDIVHSYAWWDASYRFMRLPQSRFVEDNLDKDLLGILGFDYVMYVDRDGRITGQQWNLGNLQQRFPDQPMPDTDTLRGNILATAIRLGALEMDGDSRHTLDQLLQVDGVPQLLLSYPISSSSGRAEPAGAMIAGVLLDSARLSNLQTQMGARLRLVHDQVQGNDWRTLNIPTGRGATLLSSRRVLDENSQQMSLLYLDSRGKPQLRLEVTSPRPLYQQGQQSVRLFLYLTLALLGGATLLAYLALEFRIIRRVTSMNREVAAIGEGDSQARLSSQGHDELGQLASQINLTLDRVERSEARDRAILDAIRDGFFEMDSQGIIRTVNPALCRMLGYSSAGLSGQHFSVLLQDEDRQRARSLYRQARDDEQETTFSAPFRRRDGRLVSCETRLSAIRDNQGGFHGFRGILRDISDQVAYQKQLLDLAFRDTLTGLGNRKAFNEQLQQAVTRCGRVALLYIDLDRFKQVNDRFGHATGDALLSSVGERMRGSLRQPDQAFRLGGDEFAVLLENAEPAQAEGLGQRLLDVLGAEYRLAGQAIDFVTPSIGIAFYPQDAVDADALTRAADIAMYQAKQERNRCYRYSAA